MLNELQEGRVLCPDGTLLPQRLIEAFELNPSSTILTFTNKAANELNNLITSTAFANATPLCFSQLDSETDAMPIYKGMRVMITQNRDKPNNVVNGQIASVEMCHNATIILKLPGNKLVPTYPVTFLSPTGRKTCYPFRVGYATTMCKAQGQTLTKAILWFDIDNIPPGTAYIALSRVRNLADLLFVTPLKTLYFKPVTQMT
jgi:ATP-dependent exoDNAse (exonuclease V) alpha subunit